MKTADIVVGQKYHHKDYDNVIYLGVGERDNNNHDIFNRKKLVVFLNPYDVGSVGAIVASPRQAPKGFWDKFYPAN